MSINFQKARKRLSHRKDIVLSEKDYKGWTKKATFYDLVLKEYFNAIPRNILKYDSAHPKRGIEKRRQTCLKQYGMTSASKNQTIKEKTKNTNIKKYGVENPQQNKHIKEKTKETLKKRYGVENPAKLSSKRFIKETGEHIIDWYNKLSNDKNKPAYSTLIHNIENKPITMKELNNFMSNYKSPKTLLETKAEQIFESTLYNKKITLSSKDYKPDFKLSDTVYVNVDGLYWHSDAVQKDRRYHYNMHKQFEEKGFRLFQFYENEMKEKPEVCKTIVNRALNSLHNKLNAKDCEVKSVLHKEAKPFLDKNCLAGSIISKHLGLYYNDKLVSLISYRDKNNICKIVRHCSLIDHHIVKSLSVLTDFLEKNYVKSTITELQYCADLRYETGNELLELNFSVNNRDELGWRWTDHTNTFSRLKCRANMDERKLSQKQHAEELKWFKIFDAGQRKYTKQVKI